MNKAFSSGKTFHFADDTAFIFSSKKLSTIETVINHELKHLVEWLNLNKLSLNATKTELILFRSSHMYWQAEY